MYNVDQIAEELGISVKSVRNKISLAGLKKKSTIDRRAYYSRRQVDALHGAFKSKKEVWFIYESKMNQK